MSEHDNLLSDFDAVKDSEVAYLEEKELLAKEIANMISTNDMLVSDVEALKTEINSMLDAKKEAQDTVKRIQAEYDTLMSNFQTVDTAAKKANEEHLKAKEMFEKKLAKANKVADTKKEALSMALQRYLGEVEAKQAAEERVSELESEIKKTEAINRELEGDVSAMNKFIAAKDRVLDDLQCRFNHLQSSMEAVVEQYHSTLEKKKELEAKHQEEQLKMLRETVALRDALEDKDTEVKQAQNEAAAMTKLAERKEAEVLSARCENDSLRATLEETRKQVEQEKERCTQVQEEVKMQISDMAKEMEQKEAELDDRVSALIETIEQKEAELESTALTCDSLRASLKEMRKARDQDIEELQQRVSSMNHKVAQKITALNAAELELSKLKEELEAAHDHIEQMEKDSNDVERNATFSKELITKKESEIEMIKARCANLQAALEEAEELRREEIAKREAAEQLRDSEHDEAKMSVLDLKGVVERKNEEITELRTKCDSLEVSLARVERLLQEEKNSKHSSQEVFELNLLLEDKDAEIKELTEKAETMKAAIQKAKDVYLTESHKKAECDKKTTEEHEAALNKIAYLEELLKNKESEVELVINRCSCIQASLEQMEERHRQQIEMVKKEAQEAVEKLTGNPQVEVVLDGNKQDELSMYKARCTALQVALDKAQDMYQKLAADREISEDRNPGSTYRSYSPRVSAVRSVPSSPREFRADQNEKKNRWLGLRKRENETSSQSSVGHGTMESREERRARLGLLPKWRSSTNNNTRAAPESSRPRLEVTPRSERLTGMTQQAKDGALDQDRIQAQIPAHIRSNFLEIGFYKQRLQNMYLPVLCLGPFDVPSGPIRDDWLSKIEKDSKVLSLGVYFYGKTGGSAYGTIPWFSFIPFEKAAQRGFDKVPKEITDKMNAGQALEDYEKELVEGIKLAKAAVDKDPEFRTHPLYHLVDRHTKKSKASNNVPEIVTMSASQDHTDHVSEMGF